MGMAVVKDTVTEYWVSIIKIFNLYRHVFIDIFDTMRSLMQLVRGEIIVFRIVVRIC